MEEYLQHVHEMTVISAIQVGPCTGYWCLLVQLANKNFCNSSFEWGSAG